MSSTKQGVGILVTGSVVGGSALAYEGTKWLAEEYGDDAVAFAGRQLKTAGRVARRWAGSTWDHWTGKSQDEKRARARGLAEEKGRNWVERTAPLYNGCFGTKWFRNPEAFRHGVDWNMNPGACKGLLMVYDAEPASTFARVGKKYPKGGAPITFGGKSIENIVNPRVFGAAESAALYDARKRTTGRPSAANLVASPYTALPGAPTQMITQAMVAKEPEDNTLLWVGLGGIAIIGGLVAYRRMRRK